MSNIPPIKENFNDRNSLVIRYIHITRDQRFDHFGLKIWTPCRHSSGDVFNESTADPEAFVGGGTIKEELKNE